MSLLVVLFLTRLLLLLLRRSWDRTAQKRERKRGRASCRTSRRRCSWRGTGPGGVGGAAAPRLPGLHEPPRPPPLGARPHLPARRRRLLPPGAAPLRDPRGRQGRRHRRQLRPPADFIADNLLIQTNVVRAAHLAGSVRKLLFLGSSCIYPKFAPQPIPESALLSGPLEPTNQWYAVAKIAGVKLCQAFRLQHGLDAVSAMPTNLYGPRDNFHPDHSHVLPALLRRFHLAKLAAAPASSSGAPAPRSASSSTSTTSPTPSGAEISIRDLAEMVRDVVGFRGEIVWDASKPDGTPRKLMDSSKIAAMGWKPRIALRDGLVETYKWYVENAAADHHSQSQSQSQPQ
uniref:NAD-dependent epimerase/dehydratase domain-containing protein n=1 Tax=Ananas comosus var. bracteatus TaxID=296719 RepID=A0A6V7PMT1_ANACO|nr:unnamed protein product [Ananas comosus var. bracteatus]